MLTKSGVHSVRALVVLATLKDGEYRGAASVAEVTDAPRNYLGKLLQMLARRGLVQSQKGLGGGFRLARDPKSITLFDVVRSLEDFSRWTGCILGRAECSDSDPCPVHAKWGPVRDGYLGLLENTSIADLVPPDGDPL